jgi:hypothetical protein
LGIAAMLSAATSSGTAARWSHWRSVAMCFFRCASMLSGSTTSSLSASSRTLANSSGRANESVCSQ